jgi:UDP-N-acetylglucosamine acyltransferase
MDRRIFSAIHQFVKIGQNAFIAGGSLVRKDVPPYIKAVRESSKLWRSKQCGLKRRGFSQEKINQILIFTASFIIRA